jgi:hypothetical protein
VEVEVTTDRTLDLTIPTVDVDVQVTDTASSPLAGADIRPSPLGVLRSGQVQTVPVEGEVYPGAPPSVAYWAYHPMTATDSSGVASLRFVRTTATVDLFVTPPPNTGYFRGSAQDVPLLSDSAVTIALDGVAAAPVLTATPIAVTEGNGASKVVQLQVSISAQSGSSKSVRWQTYDAAAQPAEGADYVAASGTLSFAGSETTRTFSITINGDALDEADEPLFVVFSEPENVRLGGYGLTGVNILDDDPPPAISSTVVTAPEGNSGTRVVQVPVSLSAASGKPVTVGWRTYDEAAQPAEGADYTAASGTITFTPGQTSRTFPVTIRGDTLDEPDEPLFIIFSNPTNATLGGFGLTGISITDDD